MKKLLLAVLGVCSLVGFVGCGSKDEIKYDYKGKGKLVSAISDINRENPKGELLSYKRRTDTIYDENDQVVFIYNYTYDEETKKWKKQNKTENTYNDQGILILEEYESYTISKEGRVQVDSKSTTYEYENGLLIRETDSDGIEQTVTLYTYDSTGKKISSSTRAPRSMSKGEYEYDENNNLIKETSYISYSSGYLWDGYSTEYTYDSNNRLITEIFLTQDDEDPWKYQSKEEYTYDDNGNLLKEVESYYRNDDWKPDTKYEMTYDSNNSLLTKTYFDMNEDGQWAIHSKSENTYDSNNNKIGNVYYVDDRSGNLIIGSKYEFTYNKKNELTEEKAYSLPNKGDELKLTTVTKYKYTYYK